MRPFNVHRTSNGSNLARVVEALRPVIFLVTGVTILVAPALYLGSSCSVSKTSQRPVGYEVTIGSVYPKTEEANTEDVPLDKFALAPRDNGFPSEINSAQTTKYATEEVGAWWRRFWCGINGADYLLGMFTLCLALATGLLWDATRRTLTHAKVSGERQQRAYVLVSGATRLEPFGPNQMIGPQIGVRNFGQTPAYDVRVYLGQPHFGPFGDADGLPVYQGKPCRGAEVLGPGQDIAVEPEKTLKLKQAMFDQTVKETHATFVYGWINYRDAFGENRTTKFRLFAGGPNGNALGGELIPHERGNEAD